MVSHFRTQLLYSRSLDSGFIFRRVRIDWSNPILCFGCGIEGRSGMEAGYGKTAAQKDWGGDHFQVVASLERYNLLFDDELPYAFSRSSLAASSNWSRRGWSSEIFCRTSPVTLFSRSGPLNSE